MSASPTGPEPSAGTDPATGPDSSTGPAPIRPARPDDVPGILELVRELARYEREPDAVRTTPEMLRQALFGDAPSVFAHVAERDGELVGLALWFLTFSTWEGVHGIWLEDLYVRPTERRRGTGAALVRTLAALCTERGYARLEWCVLNWNAPSIAFYEGLGARPQSDWTTYRLTGDALARTSAAAGRR